MKKLYFFFPLVLLLIMIGVQSFFALSFSKKVNALLKEHHFSGVVLIAKKGKILINQAHGFANEEYRIPNTLKTVFRIGSLTKQFTAVAILQLQEKGLLKVQDRIIQHLPDYPQNEITIHQLLCHTSGVPNLTKLSNFSQIQKSSTTIHQTLDYFKYLPLDFAPGTDCEYSDSNYLILGAIIEEISKKPYEEYLRSNIFLPLEMHSTCCEFSHRTISQQATGYTKKSNGTSFHADYIDMSLPHAAGGLVSTTHDLYKWEHALQEASFLTPASLTSLFTVHASNAERKIAYGYGFRVGSLNAGMEECEDAVGHFGTINGFKAALICNRDEDLTVILLSNVEETPVQLIQKELRQLIRTFWRSCAMPFFSN